MRSPPRRVAVTGASGYVAAGLIRLLEGDDSIERVLAVDLRPPRSNFSQKVIFREADVTSPLAGLFSEHGVEAVVHLAFVLDANRNRRASRRVNVEGTINVLRACVEAEVGQVVYLSSTTVYGAHPDNPPLLTEESPVRPIPGFQYGEDKLEGEAAVARFVGEHPDLRAVVLRSCPVLGPTADNFIARALSRPVLLGFRSHNPPMQLLHEDDLSDLMRLCLEQGATGIFNVAGEGTIPWRDMASIAGRRMVSLPAPLAYGLIFTTWHLRLQREASAAGLDFVRHRWTADTGKLRRELDFTPRHSSRETWQAFVARRSPSASVVEAGR